MGIFSSALSAVGGIITTNKQNKANKEIAQMNNEFNERMLDKQMTYNKEMYAKQLGDQWQFYNDAKQNAWDMAEYNSAPAARQRLEAAGLNPFMMLNGGSAGSASFNGSGSAPSAQGVTPPTASNYSADYSAMASGIGQAATLLAQESERAKIRAETEGIHIENKFKAAKAIADLNETLTRTHNSKEDIAIKKFMANLAKDMNTSNIAVNNQNIANMRAEEKFTILQSLTAAKNLSWMDAQNRMDLAQKAADISLKRKQGVLTDRQAETEVYKVAESFARAQNINASTENIHANTENINQSTENLKSQGEILKTESQFSKDTYKYRVQSVVEELHNIMRGNRPKNVFEWMGQPQFSSDGRSINW